MERITREEVGSTHPHRMRYHLAAGFLQPGDAVLDAACGIGYGADILCDRGGVDYMGIDRADVIHDDYRGYHRMFLQEDLDLWSTVWNTFDVSVSFETIEHLEDPGRFVAELCHATYRTIIASVPTIPSKHFNEFHLHDFERDDLPALFAAEGWRCLDIFDQPSESSAVYVFNPA